MYLTTVHTDADSLACVAWGFGRDRTQAGIEIDKPQRVGYVGSKGTMATK
jgi:hypothetical protein